MLKAVPSRGSRSSLVRHASSPKEDDVKYALLIYDRPGTYEAMPPDEHDAVMGEEEVR